jgi:hypothetical protein
MAQKIFFRMTIVNDDGTPGSGCYVRAVDNASPTTPKTIWSDADGADEIPNSIVESDEYGDVSFFGEGVYDFKVYKIIGVSPNPAFDSLIRTYEQIDLFVAEPAFDPDSTATENTLAYAQQRQERAHFGKASLTAGVIVLEDDAAVYSLTGGTAGSTITNVTANGDFQLVESRMVIIHFRNRYQLKNDPAGDLVLDGDLWTWDGTILGLIYTAGKLREMFRSHNVDKTNDVAYIAEAVTTYGTDGETLVVPAPTDVVVVAPGDDPNVLREIWWLAEGQRAKPGQRLTLIFSDDMSVADGGELKLTGDFNATPESSLSLIAVRNSGGTVRWYETARTLVDPPDDFLSEDGGDVVVSAVQNLYRIRGRANTGGGFMPDIDTITGGSKNQLITIRCTYPNAFSNDADLVDADADLLHARRKIVSSDWSDPDAFTSAKNHEIYLKDGDDFFMLPGDMLTLRRIQIGASAYAWVEESRTERMGFKPLLTVPADMDGSNLKIWRRSHLIKSTTVGTPFEIQGIESRSYGYEVQFELNSDDTQKVRFNNPTEPMKNGTLTIWDGQNRDLDVTDGGSCCIFKSRGNGFWTEIPNPVANKNGRS